MEHSSLRNKSLTPNIISYSPIKNSTLRLKLMKNSKISRIFPSFKSCPILAFLNLFPSKKYLTIGPSSLMMYSKGLVQIPNVILILLVSCRSGFCFQWLLDWLLFSLTCPMNTLLMIVQPISSMLCSSCSGVYFSLPNGKKALSGKKLKNPVVEANLGLFIKILWIEQSFRRNNLF